MSPACTAALCRTRACSVSITDRDKDGQMDICTDTFAHLHTYMCTCPHTCSHVYTVSITTKET